MNLEQFIEQLEAEEQTQYQTLVEESQAGDDSKAIRGRLARLAIGVLKRLSETPNPGPGIGQFIKHYHQLSLARPIRLRPPPRSNLWRLILRL